MKQAKSLLLLIALLLMCIVMVGCGGGKAKVDSAIIEEAAIDLAEQDYGYKLDLKSCEVVDSFTTEMEMPMSGKKEKHTVVLAILEAEAKDTGGNVVDTLLYGVSIIDPTKNGEFVVYDQVSSAAYDFTGGTKEDVKEELQRFGVSLGRSY